MKSLVTCLLAAGALALGTPYASFAQETPVVTEVPRVVIAPPQSRLAEIIKGSLSQAYYGTSKESRAYAAAQKLYFFYGARHFEPLWLTQGADGQTKFSPAAEKIMALFKDAELEGLRPSDYLTQALTVTGTGEDPERLAALETAFSNATALYAQHIYAGRIAPRQVSANFDITPRRIDEADLLVKLADAQDPAKILLALEPKHREFQALKAALAKFHDGMANDPVTVPEGQLLRVGMSDPRVPVLRQRLEVPQGSDSVYDEALAQAVMTFQDSLGLKADGVVGPATVAALNGGSATTREDIIANMERWRWMPETLGNFHVLVNIPEFRLYVERGDHDAGYEVAYTTRVVVGTPKNQTPIFSDQIRHIVVNPYWNVPASIAKNEIAPKLAANPYYLDSQNMELLYGGQVVNAAMVDWYRTDVNQFRIRQRPGPSNALGAVKFLFPNSHDVYLHDTPSKSLFGNSQRAYSHGCVRVQNPMEFADALLGLEPNMNATKLEAMYGPAERWVNLENKVPVHLAYFTLRVGEDGTIRSYGDVYGHNKRLIELLEL